MRPFALAVLLLLPAAVFGQPSAKFAGVATVSAKFEPAEAKPGEAVKLFVTVTPKGGAWTYALTQPPGNDPKHSLPPPKSDAVAFSGPAVDPPGWKEKPGALPGTTERYYDKPVTWEFAGTINAGPPGAAAFKWTGARIQACNLKGCFNSAASDLPALEFKVLPGEGGTPPPPTVVDPPTPDPPPSVAPTRAAFSLERLLAFLGQAVFWGLVSLVTPCVFPMIPITVSLFLKQSHQSAGGAVKLAAVYCGTIIVVLGLGAWLALRTFVFLSTHPVTNVLLAMLLVVFACSLFGWFDLRLPNFLLRGAEAGRKRGGLLGTVFGAVAFSIVSFTCVAPFLGGFAGLIASGQYQEWELALGGLTFGAAFASPFFVLALFPSLMKKLPRAGGWMDTVKAIMGFLELAAAFKFARTAELLVNDPTVYFTYDLCLAAFAVISAACGLYLLGLFRLPHDDAERGKLHVLQLLLALGFLGLGVYLFPGLFHHPDGQNQRPKGVVFAWVDSFLLPDTKRGWSRDLDGEVKRISGELAAGRPPLKRFIFVDFTGKTCTNCALNEQNVFPRPEVKALLDQYTLVKLYTDDVPAVLYDSTPPPAPERVAEAMRNADLLDKKFGTQQLPTYVILEPQPDGKWKKVGQYEEGLINDVPGFTEFLRKPLAGK